LASLLLTPCLAHKMSISPFNMWRDMHVNIVLRLFWPLD
jgi:hypothetical protein